MGGETEKGDGGGASAVPASLNANRQRSYQTKSQTLYPMLET